jgi:REP element-mobilizing transposase RayT
METERQFALRKVSFVPDHVHVAVRAHPAVVPAQVVLELMNRAQHIMWERFPGAVIRARVERLWQPSAYVGSYGDLATPQIQQHIRNWRQRQEKEE